MLPSHQEDTESQSGKAKTELYPIQIAFSSPHCYNCTEMRKHKQTGALAAHLISTKHCRTAADMTCVFKQAGFRQTHTPFYKGISSKIKSKTLLKTQAECKHQEMDYHLLQPEKEYKFSKQEIFNTLVRFHPTHVFSHLGACPITPTFCQCNYMHVLIHMQAV